tara:strand:- start:1449 stop:2510 length:1062 start_codon:yes stop_codon:yes gene_type:complete
MKIALITDTHFGARNDNIFFDEYFYKFYEGIFFPYLQQHGIKNCIHLGDVMDRRKFVSYRTAKNFRERFLLPFNTLEIDLHMLVGNHDIYFKNTNDINSLQELIGQEQRRFKIYPEAETVEFDGLPILMLPWINPQNEIYSFGMIDETPATICMSHLELKGFEMHGGHVSENGYDKKDFTKFDTVFSGHFHKKSDDGQVFYLGTPYQMTWSDYGCPKGFHIFDTETRELTRIENNLNIFQKIYYDDSMRDYDDHDFTQYAEKYVKLIVVNKKDLYQFDKFTEKLLKADAHDVKIVEDFSELNANNVSDEIVEGTQDTMTILNRYIEDLPIDLNKKRLKYIMKSLYTEAQDLEL